MKLVHEVRSHEVAIGDRADWEGSVWQVASVDAGWLILQHPDGSVVVCHATDVVRSGGRFLEGCG
jgi:hypothetical protein